MKTVLACMTMLLTLTGLVSAGPSVIPEMLECMQAHGSQEQYRTVLEKYCDPGIIRKAMGLLVIKDPYVLKADQTGDTVCYLVEGTTVGTSSEIPSDITQTYKVCWQQGRVKSLEFFGAKAQVDKEIIPEMLECMRAHDSREQYDAVLRKYCDSGIIREAMALLVIKDPYVSKIEKKGAVVTYTVEGRTIESSSEMPGETHQVYRVSWKHGRVIGLEFLGPGDETGLSQ